MIIGSNILFYKNLPSTNNHTAFLLKTEELQEGTIIHTNYQSEGKGQTGNKWESEDGKNLLISVLLYPYFINPDDQFLISMIISLGLCDFSDRYITSSCIKWPNDIYVNNDKIAGILIESSIMGNQIENTIVGIGININQKKFLSSAPNPASLCILTGKEYDLSVCLDQLKSDLDKRYRQLLSKDYDQIRVDYIRHLFRLNEWHGFRDKEGIFTGRIISVTEQGNLLIEKQNNKLFEYSFKEVEIIL